MCCMKTDGRKLDHAQLEEMRREAVRRVRQGGERPSVVIASLGLNRTTIYQWLSAFEKKGNEGLARRIAPGPLLKLPEQSWQHVGKMISGHSPSDYGFKSNLWSRSIVQKLVGQEFGIRLSLSAIGRWLGLLGVGLGKTVDEIYKQYPEVVRRWHQDNYPSLFKKFPNHKFFLLQKTSYGKHSPRKDGIVIHKETSWGNQPDTEGLGLSAVGANGTFWYTYYAGVYDDLVFTDFLKRFLKRMKTRVILVVDDHPAQIGFRVFNFRCEFFNKLEIAVLHIYGNTVFRLDDIK